MALTQSTPLSHHYLWLALTYYNFYRLILVILFFSLFALEKAYLGGDNPFLFTITNSIYSLFAVIALGCVFLKKPNFHTQVIIEIFIDIFAITILMFASGGPESGLGMLLITITVAGGLFTPGQQAYLYAAIATLAILSEQIYTYLNLGLTNVNFPNAGILGITLFASSAVMSVLSKRLGKTEALSKKQFEKLIQLEQLNELVIQKMQSGVLITNAQNQILLINQSAQNLFESDGLPEILKPYCAHFFKEHPKQYNPILTLPNQQKIQLSFLQLGSQDSDPILIFIENLSEQFKKSQEIKLASLGRLTASIAHELRNPLGAISHAAQLLLDDHQIQEPHKRFSNLIYKNANRMEQIIKSVLALSKENKLKATPLEITSFLQTFTTELQKTHPQKPKITLDLNPSSQNIWVDPTHLHQILTNLCDNGIFYSLQNQNQPTLTIKTVCDLKHALYYINVIDQGAGISTRDQQYLFEPFFTTKHNGIGLGLYLARQLAQYHHGTIEYKPTQTSQSCFQIIFPLKDYTHEKTT